jgi:hypothetical protein
MSHTDRPADRRAIEVMNLRLNGVAFVYYNYGRFAAMARGGDVPASARFAVWLRSR